MSNRFNCFIDSLNQKILSIEASEQAKKIVEGFNKFKSSENGSKAFTKQDNFNTILEHLDSFLSQPKESPSMISTSASLPKSKESYNMNLVDSTAAVPKPIVTPPKLILSQKGIQEVQGSKVIIKPKQSADPLVKFGVNPNQPKDVRQVSFQSDFQVPSLEHSIQLIPEGSGNVFKFKPITEMQSERFEIENEVFSITYMLERYMIKVDKNSENTFIISKEFPLIHAHTFQISNDQIVPLFKLSEKSNSVKLRLRYIRSIGICYQDIKSESIIRINESGHIMLDESESYKEAFKVFQKKGKWMIKSLLDSNPLLRNLHSSLTRNKLESLPLCLNQDDILKIGEKFFKVKITG